MRLATIAATIALLAACDFSIDAGSVADPVGPDAGAAPECGAPWTCPPAADGRANICGSFADRETGAPIADGGIELTSYDQLRFLADPDGAPSMAATIETDGCGRFRALDVAVPVEGMLALVTSDAGDGDTWARTSHAVALPPSRTLDGVSVPATRTATIEQWTTTAGAPFGAETFVDTGVLVLSFEHQGQPLAGVHAMVEGIEQHAFYFADTDPTSAAIIDPALEATGPNGTALLVNTDGKRHTGYGGEPTGCTWTTARGASTATVITGLTVSPTCP